MCAQFGSSAVCRSGNSSRGCTSIKASRAERVKTLSTQSFSEKLCCILFVYRDMLLSPGSKFCVQEGAVNNLPDNNAFRAARDIHKMVSNLTSKDIVIVLMSGW